MIDDLDYGATQVFGWAWQDAWDVDPAEDEREAWLKNAIEEDGQFSVWLMEVSQ